MKALVLLSGGLDSSTCLAIAIDKYGADNVVALSVFYGQKHDKELFSAMKIADYYDVQLKCVDLKPLFEDSGCSLLKQAENKIPEESYAEQLQKTDGKPVSTYVPFRNGLFLSVAASMAIVQDCQEIYYGAHADDAAGNAYPDCSTRFNSLMNDSVYVGSGQAVRIVAPFIDKNKSEVVRIGTELGVPYELTWSCYKGGEKPCGKCGTCIDRQKAFEANGLKDPLL